MAIGPRTKNQTVTSKSPVSNEDTAAEDGLARNLRLLRAILDVPSSSNTINAPRRPKTPLVTISHRNARTTRSAKVDTKDTKDRPDRVQEETLCGKLPSTTEQKKLAMNCFNQSLKALSTAAKNSQASSTQNLQESSAVPGNTTKHNDEKYGKMADKDEENIVVNAECACAALAVLRLYESREPTAESSSHKREQGAVLLLDKMITLNLKDIAHIEAYRIHEQYWKRRRSGSKEQLPKTSSRKVDIAVLLPAVFDTQDTKDFDTLTSFQSQLLRLALLHGSTSLDKKFLQAVRVKTKGSPAEVVISGCEKGYVNAQTAGQNLRTISQALSRLYAIMISQPHGVDMNQESLVLDLLAEAQLTKLAAWRILNYEPDLDREYWTPVERAVKVLWHKRPQQDQSCYMLTKSILEKLQSELEECSFPRGMPARLSRLLIQLSESNDPATALVLLESLRQNVFGVDKLNCLCQITAITLQDASSENSAVRGTKETTQLFDEVVRSGTVITGDDLVIIVHLRKACFKKLTPSTQTALDTSNTQSEIEVSCLQLLSNLFDFCCFVSQHGKSDQRVQQSARLSALKVMEGLLDIERHAMSAPAVLALCYLNTLENCITSLSENDALRLQVAKNQSHQTVLEALKLRTSNVFWRAHLHSFAAQDTQYTATKLAQISMFCLDGLGIEELTKAALGPRLEKVSSMYKEAGDLAMACACTERAIKHYILAGALADAVEASLSTSSGNVWVDDASISSQLGRALHAYNAASIGKPDDTSLPSRIYDDEKLPAMHRAVLLEHQIPRALKKQHYSSTFETIREQIQHVVELTCKPQYRIWQRRFISACIFRASTVPDLDTERMLAIANSEVTTGFDSQGSDVFLKSLDLSTRLQLKLQRSLLVSSPNEASVEDDLNTFYTMVASCSTKEPIESMVDDIEVFSQVIQAYINQVFSTHNYKAAIPCLKIRVLLEERSASAKTNLLIECHICLALSYVRLDDLGSAATALARADELKRTAACDHKQAVDLHLAYAEYYLAVPSLEDCKASLAEGGQAFIRQWPPSTAMNSSKQIERDSIVAKAALLASTLALRQGNIFLANQYARQATKISISVWSALERRMLRPDTSHVEDSTVASLSHDLSKLEIVPREVSPPRFIGAKYWPHLCMHIHSIKHLASILSRLGLCEDALHYLRQLDLVSTSMPLSQPFQSPAPDLSLLYAKAGKPQEAVRMIESSEPLLRASGNQYGLTDAVLSCCEAYLAQGDLLHAQSLASNLPEPVRVETSQEPKPTLGGKESRQPTQARRGIAVRINNRSNAKRQIPTSKPNTRKPALTSTQSCKKKGLSFQQAANEDRLKAILHACNEDTSTTLTTISNTRCIELLLELPRPLVHELYEEARHMLSEAWHKLSADTFASVLTESAVALPSKTHDLHRRPRVSFLQGGGDAANATNSSKSSSSLNPDSSIMQSIGHMLQTASKLCNVLLKERHQYCSMDMIHSLVKMEARTSLLLASMNLPFVISSTDLVLKALQPKDYALERERIASVAEQMTQNRSDLSVWPSGISNHTSCEALITPESLKYLPSSWVVISIAIAEDNDELLLSRTIAGRDPFLVRIPLRRSNEGDGVDEFSFEEAKTEMLQIIENANFSSHDVRGASNKVTRAEWHSDREALDRQLASLLENIESIWLGGFRGILSPHPFRPKRVEDFGQALIESLNRNLPSRQRSNTTEERIEMHEHVLDIFLGLGSPDDHDLDDSVMDLLYFVVDILQFNGERNAYDEIDWDAILIDVLDALRACHKTRVMQPPCHTILVLDKELEAFPWEALPCLFEHSVSRMPSLGSIFDRLSRIRAQSSREDASAFEIVKSSSFGAYVLNPSGDLTGTQSLFEPILNDNLSSLKYTAMVNEPPTEGQFSSLLQRSDVLLYIGHGSGAQYIRPRTIRALPSCAVTFLFGCSSAKMTEHGAFENTGMPRAYMLGHAPAVVGCLWDVTDREIDRVALKTLASWGLIDNNDERIQEGLRKKGRKGKEKARSKNEVKKKTLVEAVKDGREACVLRYLCGAAVVVYGIPIVLG